MGVNTEHHRGVVVSPLWSVLSTRSDRRNWARGAVGNEDGCLLVDTSVAADEPTQAQTYTMAERREQGWYARLAILRIALALMRAGYGLSHIRAGAG